MALTYNLVLCLPNLCTPGSPLQPTRPSCWVCLCAIGPSRLFSNVVVQTGTEPVWGGGSCDRPRASPSASWVGPLSFMPPSPPLSPAYPARGVGNGFPLMRSLFWWAVAGLGFGGKGRCLFSLICGFSLMGSPYICGVGVGCVSYALALSLLSPGYLRESTPSLRGAPLPPPWGPRGPAPSLLPRPAWPPAAPPFAGRPPSGWQIPGGAAGLLAGRASRWPHGAAPARTPQVCAWHGGMEVLCFVGSLSKYHVCVWGWGLWHGACALMRRKLAGRIQSLNKI
jgi:hypothetical protein